MDLLEIEMKFPNVDFASLRRQLRAWKARPLRVRREEDHYFNAPDRDFARTDEALRVRRIGTANRVTYKGPKLGKQTKTRTEIEVALGSGRTAAQDFCRLLEHLGYRRSLVVRKVREGFRLLRDDFPIEVCLDDVEGLGHFAEVEICALPEHRKAATALLLRTVSELGLKGEERRSYLELLLEQLGKA